MLTLNFSPFPERTTDRLLLRMHQHTDANEVLFLRSDPQVMKYIDRAPDTKLEEAIRFIDLVNNNIATNVAVSWAITLKDAPTLIGTIALWQMDLENYRAEIGYVLHPHQQGKGLMHEAISAVVAYGFGIGLHSIEANINSDNRASQRVLERSGFVKEAHFKENHFYNGKFLDTVVYSLIAPAG